MAEQDIAVLRYDKRTKAYGAGAYPQGENITFDTQVIDDVLFFVLQGERDCQAMMQDFGMWRFGLYRNPNALFISYPKLNYVLQEVTQIYPFEYMHLPVSNMSWMTLLIL